MAVKLADVVPPVVQMIELLVAALALNAVGWFTVVGMVYVQPWPSFTTTE